jgi:hypothetical protein
MTEVGNASFGTAIETVEAAAASGIPLRLIGGLAIRYLTPDYPPRVRNDQDMDFASVSTAKNDVIQFLDGRGFLGDRRFNVMHGQRQMYFTTPDGLTSVDVIVDRLFMCHELVFKERIDRMPVTIDITDLLLTKLQVVEQNEKDVHDIVYLLSAFEVKDGDDPGTIGLKRVGDVIRDDWGWWRTVTGNLDRVFELLGDDLKRLVPSGAKYDPAEQASAIRRFADTVPKTLRWKIRSRVGERVQWYELPEEVGH